ncbi:MAG: sigma-70 family RNA polymerase sigma factor [Cyclobacteriaceae bacterium]
MAEDFNTKSTKSLIVLWEQLKHGERDGFLELYELLYQELYVFGIKLVADREQVKDSLHQFFLELWDRRDELGEVNFVRAYLFKYFKRMLLRNYSTQLRRPENDAFIGHDLSYEALLIKNQSSIEKSLKLQESLKELSNKQLQVIRLKYFEGHTIEEIAEITSSEKRTVYNHIYEAMKKLKAFFSCS